MFKVFGVVLVGASVCCAAELSGVEYGRYLAEEVAKCGDCHTPRKANGEFDTSKRLKGAKLDALAPCDIKDRGKKSPDLTPSGDLFRRWGAQGMVGYLKTGLDPEGHPAAAPMPAYKLRPHDAEAIVAYLESVK
jgi:mono/diheme cytochrome c family protein